MKNKDEYSVEYEEKIREIPISKIETNSFNPRKKFVESEEDELIESILSKGILNPVIVYKTKNNTYVLLDGERRYRASQKLNISKIPAHVLRHEPDALENLSMMFHIHNVREEWTDFAIAISLKRVIEEMGKKINTLTTTDIRELTKLTSLSEYKVKKYLSFLQYPDEVVKKFLESEKKEKPDKGVDPDILMEMYRPIKNIRATIPEVLEEFSVKDIIDSCINKKANEIIKTNREFRLLSKALIATKKGQVRKELMTEKIRDFIENLEVSPEQVFSETSSTIYLMKEILNKSKVLYSDILNLDLTKLTHEEKISLTDSLQKLIGVVKEKIEL